MEKLKIPGFWAMALILAALLTLAACEDGTIQSITVDGLAIVEPYPTLTPTTQGFTISAAATVATPNQGGQVAEYAAVTTNSDTAPADGWRGSLTFSGLTAGTEYFVWARSAKKEAPAIEYNGSTANVTFNAGPAVKIGSVTPTAPEPTMSINDWDPNFRWNADNTGFQMTAATPATSGLTVEYILSTSETETPSGTWNTGTSALRYAFTAVNLTQKQYIWARTQASGATPAGAPVHVALLLPGPTLGSTGYSATRSNVTGNSATINIVGKPTPTPNIDLAVQYGLGTSDENANDVHWGDLNANNSVTITGLTVATAYHLWARSKEVTNFKVGAASRYTASSPFLTTTNDESGADGLATSITEMNTGLSAGAGPQGDTVIVSKGSTNDYVQLTEALSIPEGVTLVISGAKLDATGIMISGRGSSSIEIMSGGLKTEGRIDVPITVYSGAAYYTTGTTGAKPVLGGTNDGASIKITSGAITVRSNGQGSEYTLAGEAEIDAGITLNASDTFTISNGTLDASSANPSNEEETEEEEDEEESESDATPTAPKDFRLFGRIVVRNGGTLKLPATGTEKVFGNNNARVVINAGGKLNITDDVITGSPAIRTTDNKAFFLDSGTIEVSRMQKTPAPNATYVLKYTLMSGSVEVKSPLKNTFEYMGGTVVIPVASGQTTGTLEVGNGTNNANDEGHLIVTRDLVVAATATNKTPVLKITGKGTVSGNGTLNVSTGATLTIESGATVSGLTGKIEVRDGGALNDSISGGLTFAFAGTPNILLVATAAPNPNFVTVTWTGTAPNRTRVYTLTGSASVPKDKTTTLTTNTTNLVIGSNATLTVASGGTLTVNNPLEVNGALVITGTSTGVSTIGTLNGNSTITGSGRVTAGTGATTKPNLNFENTGGRPSGW